MESFKHLYVNACAGNHRKPDKRLLFILDQACETNSSVVNCSECLLSIETCQSLGVALAKDIHITQLDFSNCLLPEGGLAEILKGLMNNKSLICLNLMGNNIRGTGAVLLGKFLQRNDHLLQLNLDWNGLGMLPDKFSIFCEKLTYNNTLKDLGLGHNQLNYECASALGTVIVKNTSLETLRLQFNSFGHVGGKHFLTALIHNKTLIQMNVEGNNMGAATESSIEIAIKANIDKKLLSQRHAQEAKILAKRLQELDSEKTSQIKVLKAALDKRESEALEEHKLKSVAIATLQSEIREKDTALESSMTECKHLEALLNSTKTKLNEITDLAAKMETEISELRTSHSSILSKEKKKKEEVESKLLEELESCKEDMLKKMQEVSELKQQLGYQESLNQKLSRRVVELEIELKTCEATSKAQIDALKESHSKLQRDKDDLHQKEVERLTEDYSKMEQCYCKKVQALELQRVHLEKEISELKRSVENMSHEKEEELYQQQQKAKADEAKMKNQMEQKIELVTEAKKKQEKLLEEQIQTIQMLQTKNTSLSLELEEQIHQVQSLQQKLSGAEDDCQVKVAKVRLEVKEKLEELDTITTQNEEMSSEITQLKKQLDDVKVMHMQEMKLKDIELEQMKQELALQKTRMMAMAEEESKRANNLHTVITSYMKEVHQAASQHT